MGIPKIIHQTWKTINIPPQLEKYKIQWETMYPESEGYIHKFYTDIDLKNLVEEVHPEYLALWNSMTSPIERVDFARYIMLEKDGGIYSDLDMEPINKLPDSIFESNQILLASEPEEHAKKIYKRNMVLCNAFMLSPKGHPLWKKLLAFIAKEYTHDSSPVSTTGPMAITKFYENHLTDFGNVIIANSCDFFPICNKGFSKKTQEYNGVTYQNVSQRCDISKSFTVHKWANTWVRPWYQDPRWKNRKYWFIVISLLIVIIAIVLAQLKVK